MERKKRKTHPADQARPPKPKSGEPLAARSFSQGGKTKKPIFRALRSEAEQEKAREMGFLALFVFKVPLILIGQ